MSGGGSYLVTAQHATAVSLSETGNFTGPNDLNLLIARSNRNDLSPYFLLTTLCLFLKASINLGF